MRSCNLSTGFEAIGIAVSSRGDRLATREVQSSEAEGTQGYVTSSADQHLSMLPFQVVPEAKRIRKVPRAVDGESQLRFDAVFQHGGQPCQTHSPSS
jgi:homoserine kinase